MKLNKNEIYIVEQRILEARADILYLKRNDLYNRQRFISGLENSIIEMESELKKQEREENE